MAKPPKNRPEPGKPVKKTRPEPKPVVTKAGTEASAAAPGIMKLRELTALAAERSGAKMATAKAVIEAALAALGEALDRGDSLSLPPLGKLRPVKTKEGTHGSTLTLKLRRGGPKAADAPLADQGEEG